MSLSRVGSLETFAFGTPHGGNGAVTPEMVALSRRGSDASVTLGPAVRGHRLTFNPLPDHWDPPAQRQDAIQGMGAFQVPKWKRILQVAAAVIFCLVSAGIVFGFAAIKPVLKQEGAYRRECALAARDINDAPQGPDGLDTCVELRLNFMFTVAAVGSNVAALPVGAILDHHGPRVCGLLGSVLLAAGAILMAYAIPAPLGGGGPEAALPFDGLLSGYLLLALGGPFTFMSAFQLSNAFPGNSGLVMALVTGAFDASSGVFLAYRILYQETHGALPVRRFFLLYLAVPAAIAVSQLVLLPKRSYKSVTELVVEAHLDLDLDHHHSISNNIDDNHHLDATVNENTALLRHAGIESYDHAPRPAAECDNDDDGYRSASVADLESVMSASKLDAQARKAVRKNDVSGVWGALHDEPALRQVASPWFALMCLFTVVQMTRINYFVATVRAQYEFLLGSAEAAARVNGFFDLALPLGGLVAVPFIGLLLDNSSTVGVLASLVAAAALIGALGLVPRAWAAYAGIVLFVLYRPFYYTAVSDYSAKVFGFRTFGTVYGLIICLAGLLNFAQSPLDHMFHHTFGGDPVPVDVLLLALGVVIGAALVGFVAIKARQAGAVRM